MCARVYPSQPHTACTVLHIHESNACRLRLHHMVNEPAELQGYLVNAAKSPVNICQVGRYPRCCILDVNRTASIPVLVFARTRRQGLDQYQRERFAGQNSKLAQK